MPLSLGRLCCRREREGGYTSVKHAVSKEESRTGERAVEGEGREMWVSLSFHR